MSSTDAFFPHAAETASADAAQGEQDLGPLAWVIDELRKSLEGAAKALARCAREAELTQDGAAAALDTLAVQQALHQAGGALEMVDMPAPARLVHAMEAAVLRLAQDPQRCTPEAAGTLENASFALLEYLDTLLAGRAVPAVALFPQYRAVQSLAGNDKVHPADLWPAERRMHEPALPESTPALAYGPQARALLDAGVLALVKTGNPAAAAQLRAVCLGFVAAQNEPDARTFWKIAAGFFDAFAQGLIKPDVYAKRAASRVLMQYAAMAKGDQRLPERLTQDLLFFCAQAAEPGTQAPVLRAVRESFGLARHPAVDYERPRFGRFDPALLAQARKRVATATECWSALAGGDRSKIKPVVEQFGQVCDSLNKLYPDSTGLARALQRVIESMARSGEPPAPALALEVATAILYLQAALASPELADESMAAHSGRLAQRLDEVRQGMESQPLEPWMEDLYRHVSDSQTMGSVVGELRTTLAEAENLLDQFFRQPAQVDVLAQAAQHMAQMRGVLSVLGLEQACLAVARMRDTVEQLMRNEIPAAGQPPVFARLGANLGALGFLIDMLSYQRNLARQLFVYDETLGELRIIMGRNRVRASDAPQAQTQHVEARAAQPVAPVLPVAAAPVAAQPVPVAAAPAVADALPQPVAAPAAAPLSVADEDTDEELRGIFLEEAREVVGQGLEALDALAGDAEQWNAQTSLRRVFHTLKGSARMVGLDEFGEAGWAMEQMLNAWLGEQKAMPPAWQALARDALQAFAAWTQAIADGQDQDWSATPFRAAADAMRLDGQRAPVALQPSLRRRRQVPAPAAEELLPGVQETGTDGDTTPLPALPGVVEEIDFAAFESALQASERLPDAAPVPEPPAVEPIAQGAEAESGQEWLDDTPGWDDTQIEDDAAQPPQRAESPAAPVAAPLDEGWTWTSGAQAAPAADSVPVVAPAAVPDIAPAQEPVPEAEPVMELASEPEAAPVAGPVPEAALPPEPEPEPEPEPVDDNVKVIDGLRIHLPLYNVYLNEADEWSRRLDVALQEWALEAHRPQPEEAVGWAHSLAGSSATVGFKDLSLLSRALEHALMHVRPQGRGDAQQLAAFQGAANEIRRLLHQFAAGFLKTPLPAVEAALQQVLDSEIDRIAGEGSVAPGLDAEDAIWAQELDADAAEQARAQQAAETQPQREAAAEAQPEAIAFEPQAPAPKPDPIDAALALAVGMDSDIDDDIEALDALDPDLFPIFEEEAAELLPVLGTALRDWAAHPQRLEARNASLRALHTLKGSARLAGAMRLGEITHRLESAIEHIDAQAAQAVQIEPLLGSFDTLNAHFGALRALGEEIAAAPPAEPTAPMPAEPARERNAGLRAATFTPIVPLTAGRSASQQSVRVRGQLLDRLINQSGEVLIARSRIDARLAQARSSLHDLNGNLERLRQQLRDIEVQAETQMQSRLALSKDSAAGFDPLEFDRFTRVQELTRMMAESVNDVATVQRNLQRDLAAAEDDLVAQGRQARDLQRDLLRTRMVEFDAISERLYAVVRQTSKEMGKQVRLNIVGGTIEMDRGVLDRMVPAFEHLLRNCVAHGIELPAQREARGKAATGTISVTLQHEGNDVRVRFDDDGAGLDLKRIHAVAVARGLAAEDAAITAEQAGQLIFQPGFTTATEVTGVSGRGIGMDVVRSEVNALGGRIETQSTPGAGSSFALVLPLTTAVTQVVMLRVGQFAVGVPANLVEIVRRVPLAALEQAYASGQLDEPGSEQALPFFWGGALWQTSAQSLEGVGKTRAVVILRSAAQRLALHVDEVLGNQELVVKPLGPQLARLPGLTGMSVLASGAVVLIYNPVALATVYGEQVREQLRRQPAAAVQLAGGDGVATVQPQAAGAGEVPLVLVVDDSITVRRVTQRLLQREGYRVEVASDGLQALEKLQGARPAVVLSDIEMPRMDGFDLARHIRADARLHDLPIIMITSRIAQKHREHAQQIGVNHYLGKPYSDEELLSLVQRYAALSAAQTTSMA
ncbi:Hpt domain-containing protein [Pantoea sp. 18069]|uniref:hybrid sensor histidine kinase/response regulator n=1 Tax=Pantoea sp. 18069 TaxID=2681415 RepID=UPI0013579515|nr:Hpt domain-containing protein [Pantoea sp. 18069]